VFSKITSPYMFVLTLQPTINGVPVTTACHIPRV